MKKLCTLSFFILFSFLSLSQDHIWSHLRFDANLNSANKKRSYGVYSGDKYANSGYFLGLDFGLYYETKNIDFGIEYFTAYKHINGTLAYTGLNLLRRNKLKIKPNLKLGYTPILEKAYYGAGISFGYSWFHISYNKILHVKSGESKYHGDGLDVFSAGVSLKLNNKKK